MAVKHEEHIYSKTKKVLQCQRLFKQLMFHSVFLLHFLLYNVPTFPPHPSVETFPNVFMCTFEMCSVK